MTLTSSISSVYCVVPASGVGSRMQADRPKQYLPLLDKTVLEHTLARLLSFTAMEQLVLVLSSEDQHFQQLGFHHEKLTTCEGGAERYHSVLNGLKALLDRGVSEHAWVMVHDAARPCISQVDLLNLIQGANEQGAILGAQVRDTMKRSDAYGRVLNTVERECLWHALTPQLAPLKVLHDAIEQAIADGINITDEASALEHVGLRPRMISGDIKNIKVTHPQDLSLAAIYLQECNS